MVKKTSLRAGFFMENNKIKTPDMDQAFLFK